MTAVIIRGPLGRAGLDSRLDANYHGAGAAGFERGMYALFRPEWTAQEQAAHFATIWARYAWELPPSADFEIAAPDGRNLAAEIHAYLMAFEAATGVRPVIYTSARWWNGNVGCQPWTSQYRLWAAGYPDPQHTMKQPGQWWPGYAPQGWPGDFPYGWQFATLPGADYGVQSAYIDMNWFRV